MAKVKLNPAFLEFPGAMGDMVFKKRNGKIYVSMKPKRDETREPSEAQLASREVFKQAGEYTKVALADETLRAFYEGLAQGKDTAARALCMGDYLNPPTVDELDLYHYHGRVGDRIRITTQDDVGAVTVDVTLTNIDGTTIEKGQAVELWANSGQWEYVATVPVAPGTQIFVVAEAYDRPGHRAVASEDVIVGESH
jgi:hypothetical protein